MPNAGADLNTSSAATISTATVDVAPPRARWLTYLPALNVSATWTSNLILTVGSFVVTPILLHSLSETWYGIWLFIMSIIGQMKILDLGMTSGCMKFSAGYYESRNRKGLTDVFNTSLALFFITGAIALAITTALTFILPNAYPQKLSGCESVIFVLGASFALDLACRPFAASLRARSLFFVYEFTEILTYLIFKFGLVVYLASLGLSIWTLCLLTLAETVIRNGAVILWSLKMCDWTRSPNPFAADWTMLKKLSGYSSAVFIMSIADLVRFQLSFLIIMSMLENAEYQVTVYNIGTRLIGLAATTIGVIGAILIPKFSGMAERGAVDEMNALLRKAANWTGLLTVFSLMNIAIFGLPFLHLWLKKDWVGESHLLTMLMLPAYFINLLQGPAGGMLSGSGKLRWVTVLTVSEAVVNLTLSLLLVPHYGIQGIVLGMAIPMAIFKGLLFPLVVRHEMGIPFLAYYRMHAPNILLGAAYLALIAPIAFMDLTTWPTFIAAAVASTGIFLALLWATRAEFRDWCGRKVARFVR